MRGNKKKKGKKDGKSGDDFFFEFREDTRPAPMFITPCFIQPCFHHVFFSFPCQRLLSLFFFFFLFRYPLSSELPIFGTPSLASRPDQKKERYDSQVGLRCESHSVRPAPPASHSEGGGVRVGCVVRILVSFYFSSFWHVGFCRMSVFWLGKLVRGGGS